MLVDLIFFREIKRAMNFLLAMDILAVWLPKAMTTCLSHSIFRHMVVKRTTFAFGLIKLFFNLVHVLAYEGDMLL